MKVPIKKLIKEKDLIKKIFPEFNHLNYQTLNPHNNMFVHRFPFDDKVNELLLKTEKANEELKHQTLDDQIKKFENLRDQFIKNKGQFAHLITEEMGKPINESMLEVDRTVGVIEYYISESPKLLGKHKLPSHLNFKNHYEYQPLGTVLTISPWNLPLAVPLKSIIPCLFARNSVILKPAPNVPQTTRLLDTIFKNSGFKNEFQITFSDHNSTERIISDPNIKHVIFTGSTQVGRHIAQLCGKYLKKSLIELGGSDSMIILDDFSVDEAVNQAFIGRMRANGQTCTSTKRILIAEKIYDEFIDKLRKKINKTKTGDPMDPINDVGPIARMDLFLKLQHQLSDYIEDFEYSIDMGNYIKPLIVENPTKNSIPYQEEIFGPAFTTFKCKNENEMIEIANDTKYGLNASCLSNDIHKAKHILDKVDSGMCSINSCFTTHPSIPFGGVKESGFGRANSNFIFNEVCNVKSYSILKH